MSRSPEYLITVSQRAEAQLDGIVEYIAARSPSNAEMVYLRIHEVIRSLVWMPRRFPMSVENDGPDTDVRQTVICGYRVVYEIYESDKVIQVVSIRHAARLPAEDLTSSE